MLEDDGEAAAEEEVENDDTAELFAAINTSGLNRTSSPNVSSSIQDYPPHPQFQHYAEPFPPHFIGMAPGHAPSPSLRGQSPLQKALELRDLAVFKNKNLLFGFSSSWLFNP
jgi:hypothetical protein